MTGEHRCVKTFCAPASVLVCPCAWVLTRRFVAIYARPQPLDVASRFSSSTRAKSVPSAGGEFVVFFVLFANKRDEAREISVRDVGGTTPFAFLVAFV